MISQKIFCIDSLVSKAKPLNNRNAATSIDEEKISFPKISDYQDNGIYVCKFSGESTWEKHLSGEEFIQVFSGNLNIKIISNDSLEIEEINLNQGMFAIIPKGKWHKLLSKEIITVMTITPQPTQTSINYPLNEHEYLETNFT